VQLDQVFVADAAIGGRRKAGVWHPLFHIVSMVAFPMVYSVYAGLAEAARDIAVGVAKRRKSADVVDGVGALDTELMATRNAIDSMVAFSETATPGPETTNIIFMHRALVARSALKTAELALEVVGGAGYSRSMGLERIFRDIQAARFHPLTTGPQQRFAGRMALGLAIDAA
jgi:acyl-CoA dehydrogenase